MLTKLPVLAALLGHNGSYTADFGQAAGQGQGELVYSEMTPSELIYFDYNYLYCIYVLNPAVR